MNGGYLGLSEYDNCSKIIYLQDWKYGENGDN